MSFRPKGTWGDGYPGWEEDRNEPLRNKRWPARFHGLAVETPPPKPDTAKEVPLVKADEIVKWKGWHAVLIPRLIDSLFNWFRNNVYHLREESPAAPYYELEGPLLKPPGAGTDENPFVMRLPPLFIPTRMTEDGDGNSHVFMELPLHHSVSYLKAAAPRAIARRWTVNGPQGPAYEFEIMCHLKGTWMAIELPSWENVEVLLQEMPTPNPSLGQVVLRMQLNVRLPTAETPPHEYTHYTYHYILDLDSHTPVPQPVKMEHVPVARKRQRRK
ncbi:hypothetical protein JCM10296v2_000996 [Rhodotorula toruloides]